MSALRTDAQGGAIRASTCGAARSGNALTGAARSASAQQIIRQKARVRAQRQRVDRRLRLRKAGAGPVVVTPISVFGVTSNPALRFGWYGAGSPNDKTELFNAHVLFTMGSGEVLYDKLAD